MDTGAEGSGWMPVGGRRSGFQAPRALEYPLVPLHEVEGETIVWIQPQPLIAAYECWADNQVVATLRFRSINEPNALAVAENGLWTIEPNPLDKQVLEIKHLGKLYAQFHRRSDAPDLLLFLNGPAFVWVKLSLEQASYGFATETGLGLMQLEPEVGTTVRSRIKIARPALLVPETSLLLLLGQYLLLSRNESILPKLPGHIVGQIGNGIQA